MPFNNCEGLLFRNQEIHLWGQWQNTEMPRKEKKVVLWNFQLCYCVKFCIFQMLEVWISSFKEIGFLKTFFFLVTTVLQALREMSDRFAKNAQFLLHIFYLGEFKLLRNLALCHYSHLCRKNKRRKQETRSRNRPSTQRQFSSHFTGRGMDLKFLCFQVPLNCVLELIVGIKSLVTSMPSRSTRFWERSKMCSLKI